MLLFLDYYLKSVSDYNRDSGGVEEYYSLDHPSLCLFIYITYILKWRGGGENLMIHNFDLTHIFEIECLIQNTDVISSKILQSRTSNSKINE